MKDTQLKQRPASPLLLKSKVGIKKKKMVVKKTKEQHKTPIMKVGKGKKHATMKKKANVSKDNNESKVKRKPGRPKNENRSNVKKPVKRQKIIKKIEEKTGGRKRKVNSNSDVKNGLEFPIPPVKKSKANNFSALNGVSKITSTDNHKILDEKDLSTSGTIGSPIVTSNGTIHSKKSPVLGQKKSPFSILKSATFHPPPKKELMNGNGHIAPFKMPSPVKNKSSLRKDSGISFFTKNSDMNSKMTNVLTPFKVTAGPMTNELFQFHTKDAPKFGSSEPLKAMFKEPVKSFTKESLKLHLKDPVKIPTKDTIKSFSKDLNKSLLKEPIKLQPKEQLRSLIKEPVKTVPKEAPKPLLVPKEQIKAQSKEPVKTAPKEAPKTSPEKVPVKMSKIPVEKMPMPFFKSHPRRMSSLDALAKMHVICTTDRKPSEPKHTPVSNTQPFCHQKSITQCHERIVVKKETNDFKGSIVSEQQINLKQRVFVSHSVEESAIVEHEQSKTISTKVQDAGKKRLKSIDKLTNSKQIQPKLKQAPSNQSKSEDNQKSVKNKSKVLLRDKTVDPKSAKIPCKAVAKVTPKAVKLKDTKGVSQKTKKVEQTKSEVKVKKTIRLHKTCTYQTVTTVNSHTSANSNAVPVSHVGMTTNFSKTQETVVTDEECKNKVNFSSGNVVNNSYCLTTESPCTVAHSDCCKFHSHNQIIPVAHRQACSLNHNRSSDATTSHCDGGSMHRFGHQQPMIFSTSPSSEYSCCCSSSLMKNVHNPCILRKSIVAYPQPVASHHGHHVSASNFMSESACTDCQSNNSIVDSHRCHAQHYTIPSPSSHSRVSCCSCCDIRHDNSHHQQNSLQYVSEPKTSSNLVPCEQSPLDLSLTSTNSNNSIESDISLPQGHCSSPLLCGREVLLLRTSPRCFQHHKFLSNRPCCKCNKNILSETQGVNSVQSLSCSNNSIIKVNQPPSGLQLLASAACDGSSVHPIPSTSGVTHKTIPHVITDDSLLTAKREKSISPKQLAIISKKQHRVFAHGWSWKGKPREKLIALSNDSTPCARVCYPSMQHKEGDTISERDCVLLKSGAKDTDLPYVAKISAFWENPEDGEMMMSLLWYYRPEHTDQGRKSGQMEDEVFASRHKDVNSVACIDDKCYVLTYNEYCRYKASLSMEEDMISFSSRLVPDLPDGYPRKSRLPQELVSQDIIFFCRHVYDFRQKRILKNPS